MLFGGNDWLALTTEPTLELEIPICELQKDVTLIFIGDRNI